jgi:mono/diheme cytochrome c family protein
MQIQELAEVAIAIAAEDVAALERYAAVEDAAFESYVTEYAVESLMVCKGCHGG